MDPYHTIQLRSDRRSLSDRKRGHRSRRQDLRRDCPRRRRRLSRPGVRYGFRTVAANRSRHSLDRRLLQLRNLRQRVGTVDRRSHRQQRRALWRYSPRWPSGPIYGVRANAAGGRRSAMDRDHVPQLRQRDSSARLGDWKRRRSVWHDYERRRPWGRLDLRVDALIAAWRTLPLTSEDPPAAPETGNRPLPRPSAPGTPPSRS